MDPFVDQFFSFDESASRAAVKRLTTTTKESWCKRRLMRQIGESGLLISAGPVTDFYKGHLVLRPDGARPALG